VVLSRCWRWRRGVHLDHHRGVLAQPLARLAPTAAEGARLFHAKGCEFCHAIAGYGGKRGPDLTLVAGRMTYDQIVGRITNGSPTMPAYTRILQPAEVQALAEFSPPAADRAAHGAT
jgi:ubiquinol-cytochrome c reductase cytochrome b subunit